MGGVLGQHGMLHSRSEVDVEYGEEEQAVDDQGDEDVFPICRKMRLSRADHMITVHVHILHAQFALYNDYGCIMCTCITFTRYIKLVKLAIERVALHCSL